MSDVLVWIPGVFPDTRPLWLTQVSTVINLHRSKLPRIPNEGEKGKCVVAQEKERRNEENRGQRRREKKVEVTTGNSRGAGRRKQNTIDEDSDGS